MGITKQDIVLGLRRNTFIRTIAAPYVIIDRRKRHREFLRSEDCQYLRLLKDKHKGMRCFVIGNGPSLLPTDLEILKENNEICFASNRIYNIFPRTSWRPSYYLSRDFDGLSIEIEKIKKLGNFPKFLTYKARKISRTENDDIHFFFVSGPYSRKRDAFDPVPMNGDISNFVSQSHTVTTTAIEFAVYMGFSKIYLLGMDNNYVKKRIAGKIVENSELSSSYFDGMKDNYGCPGDGISVQDVEGMNKSFELCLDFARHNEVEIYNATRGGLLEVFPRVHFDSFF